MNSKYNLAKDNTPNSIQAFPLIQDRIDITSGTFTDIALVHCVSDGDIVLTWEDDTTTTKSLVAGADYTVQTAKSVEVLASSGTFDLA